MELLFILLSLACQILLLSHASEMFLGSKELIKIAGITFTGRGLMILSVIFLVLAAFFGIMRISNSLSEKQDKKKLEEENARLQAEKVKSDAAQARQQEVQQ